jgi:hypothetical protein
VARTSKRQQQLQLYTSPSDTIVASRHGIGIGIPCDRFVADAAVPIMMQMQMAE